MGVVKFLDAEGNEIVDYTAPNEIFPINDDYLMLGFEGDALLANHATGDLWSVSMRIPEQPYDRAEYYGYTRGLMLSVECTYV